MARYSFKRRDRKIAGVASRLGDVFNIDPTVIRIAFVALALVVSFKFALLAYGGAAIWLHVKEKKLNRDSERRSDFDRMAEVGTGRTSIHALRTQLDVTDRRMMAIDDHLARPNDALAREIEALREDK
ncbi:MAG: PspC domain-containing protein [Sphingomicrobium sp.]|nr:PspC domain-containing protein [Sphingomonadales bacterium]